MKKILLTFLTSLLVVGQSMALNYSAALSTYTTGSNTTTFAATYPNIAGGCKIDKIIFESSNTIATPVVIRVYDTCTSTTAASTDGYWILSGTNATAGNNRVEVDYPYYNPLTYTNPGFYSDTLQTTVKVWMTIIYR